MFRDILWLMLAFITFQGCKTPITIVDKQISLPGEWICQTQPNINNIDTYDCVQKRDTIVIQHAKDIMLINKNPVLDFAYAWKTYHSEPFFDAIFFDKKVRALYRDSIEVISVYEYNNQKDLIMPCVRCNGFAEIKFRRNYYKVPHRFSDEMLNIIKSYDRTIYFDDKYLESTIFISKNSVLPSFIQIQSSNGLYLITLTTKKRSENQFKLFRKINIVD